VNGWMGKTLSINLTTSQIDVVPTEPWCAKYLGGRGMACRIYRDSVAPGTRAFDAENYLIFMVGPLVASGAQGATRMTVAGKSPMAYPEKYCYGNIGGLFPAELKMAGWDGLVISGRAPARVCLRIENERVEIRPAQDWWGLGASRVGELIAQEMGERTRFLTTGIAGENLVRTAVIVGSHNSTSTAGFGAVMGSKNLKAIAVRGTQRVAVADPAGLKELNRYTIEISQRLNLSIPPDTTMSGHGHLIERIGKGGCYLCGLDCIRNKYRYGQRADLVGYRRCQAMEYYMPWKFNREEEPVETFFEAPELANDYSVCTFELRNMIAWLHACYKEGYLSENETGLPLSKIGTRQFLEELIGSIAHRRGFGAVLAEGLARASSQFSEKVRSLLPANLLPVGEAEVNLPRSTVVHALLEPMEPRMSRPIVHGGFARAAWGMSQMGAVKGLITTQVFHEIARAFWGSAEAGDVSTYEGKALAAVKIQDRAFMEDCLGLCDFAWPLAYSFNKPDHVGDPGLEVRLFSAVTGLPPGVIEPGVARGYNVQRSILLREGRKVPQEDYPAEINFTQPLKGPPPFMVPGPGNSIVNAEGNVLDREKFKAMLSEYYRLRGWDEATGRPRRDTLAAMGIEDVFEEGPCLTK
jgi:aldehyde:ferredoxin oxidoreductase